MAKNKEDKILKSLDKIRKEICPKGISQSNKEFAAWKAYNAITAAMSYYKVSQIPEKKAAGYAMGRT